MNQTNFERRKLLKLSGAAAGLASTGIVSQSLAAGIGQTLSEDLKEYSSLTQHHPIGQNLTINININRNDLDDWVLIENLTESPLVLKRFQPKWVTYGNWLLDLDKMLSRQQRGINQLEIWPNYAWTHSVKGAVESGKNLTMPTNVEHFDTTGRLDFSAGNRSLQLPCHVDDQGIVQLMQS